MLCRLQQKAGGECSNVPVFPSTCACNDSSHVCPFNNIPYNCLAHHLSRIGVYARAQQGEASKEWHILNYSAGCPFLQVSPACHHGGMPLGLTKTRTRSHCKTIRLFQLGTAAAELPLPEAL